MKSLIWGERYGRGREIYNLDRDKYFELEKRCNEYFSYWKVFDKIFEKRVKYRVPTDRGVLFVGDDNFKVSIPNGVGDGISKIIIVPKTDSIFDVHFFDEVANRTYITLEGEMRFFDDTYDSEDDFAHLNGRYAVFFRDRYVIFAEC